MKKINFPLIIGCTIIIFLICVMVFPGFFTDTSPYSNQSLLKWNQDGDLMLLTPPFPPSEFYFLGSDEIGRSVLSIIIYGTRLTISLGFFIALGRFLFALPLGLIAGFGSHSIKSIIKQLNIILSAIPALIISIIILKQNFFVTLDKQQSFLAFILILSLVGWPKLGILIMSRTEQIMKKPFIKGEIAIGKKPFKIATENVIPHLINELIVLFFMEIARALSMIMQLGIFGVFIGNIKLVRDTTFGLISYYNLSFEPEWASMLGTARVLLRSAPWIIIFPAIAFFISVLGFNMVGEGLRTSFQSKNQGGLKKYKNLISQVKRHLKPKKIVQLLVVATIVFVIVGNTTNAFNKTATFNLEQQHFKLPPQSIIGTHDTEEVSRLIIDQMKSLDITPLDDLGYKYSYDISQIYYAKEPNFELTMGNDQKKITLKENIDYALTQFQGGLFSGSLYNALDEDIINVKDYTKYNNKYVLIDTHLHSQSMVNHFASELESKSNAKGLIQIVSQNTMFDSNISNQLSDFIIISVKDTYKAYLLQDYTEIHLEINTTQNQNQGTNIFGVLKSSNETLSDDVILIGLSYNYLDSPNKMKFNLELMTQIAQQDLQKRSIIFAFFDGTVSNNHSGIHEIIKKNIYPTSKIKLFINLINIYDSRIDKTIYDYQQSPMTRYFAWSLGYFLEEKIINESIVFEELKSMDIQGSPYYIEEPLDNLLFWSKGISTIIIKSSPQNMTIDEHNALGDHLIDAIQKNNY